MIEPSVLAIGSGALRRRTAIASYDNLPQAARNGWMVIQGVLGWAKSIICPQARQRQSDLFLLVVELVWLILAKIGRNIVNNPSYGLSTGCTIQHVGVSPLTKMYGWGVLCAWAGQGGDEGG